MNHLPYSRRDAYADDEDMAFTYPPQPPAHPSPATAKPQPTPQHMQPTHTVDDAPPKPAPSDVLQVKRVMDFI